MKYHIIFFNIIFLCFFYLTLSEDNSKNIPILVQIVFRHGERVPIKSYPNDPYRNCSWGVPLGTLTKNGIQQQENLGKELRKRYIENFKIVNSIYNSSEIQVRSTYTNRTIESAYANLRGFYNISDSKNIPILTDFFGIPLPWTGGSSCPKYKKMLLDKKTSYETKFYQNNKNFLDILAKKAGFEKMLMNNVTTLYDTIYIQNKLKCPIPKWLTIKEFYTLKRLTNQIYRLQDGLSSFDFPEDVELIKINEGPLLKNIIDNFDIKEKILKKNLTIETLNDNKQLNSNFNDTITYVIFSAHDYTLANLFAIMGNEDYINSNMLYFDFTAALFYELYINDKNEYEIKILFSEREGKNIIDITDKIRGCKRSKKCLYNDFKNGVNKRIPVNIKEECDLK
ncbi:Histidine phosphatase superfamily,clade-2-containing protein [Strongyloides ratti]|uniref:acid phosphatase n=1 Tax=Strongyloides ratti TaxID=34506 RepID=A0A090KTY3_STRRB|nr:Histidine phosphatase superfamily,clade-2-containing protein [Strongyloides ratti]CEF60881.1 Histidine phosphatase superfamily,clade-2-containing protein [Strongyloides ratti]